MDVVYVVRPGEVNNELKLSLRMLEKNFTALDGVIIAGYTPAWCKPTKKIEVDQTDANKYRNVMSLIWNIARDERLGNKFVIMNDDFFIVNKTDKIPYLYGEKPLSIPGNTPLGRSLNEWGQAKYDTAMYLRAKHYSDLDYELHTPMVFDRKYLKKVSAIVVSSPITMMYRSLYGNMYGVGGSPIKDVKINYKHDQANADIKNRLFLSSSDIAFNNDNRFVELLSEYSEKSRFEK